MKEAMKLALEALEKADAVIYSEYCGTACEELQICEPAIKALEQALAEQHLQALHDENVRLGLYEQGEPNIQSYPEKDNSQPVAWMDIENGAASGLRYWSEPDNRHEVALYTTPQQRTWVGLTDEEIEQMWERTGDYDSFARAIEAAHGIGDKT